MKRIKLNNGEYTLVDNDVFELIGHLKWYIHTHGYVTRVFWNTETKKYYTVYLHRYVMGAKKGQEIDHINQRKLDNRKENLRFCNRSQNMHNVNYKRSSHLGVTYNKVGRHWVSKIRINGTRMHLGCFKYKKEGMKAYQLALSKL